MNIQDDHNNSPGDATPDVVEASEESCILIEENISVVDLADESSVLPKDSESVNGEEKDVTAMEEGIPDDTFPSEFQVIDEVVCSQEVAENGEGEDVGQVNGDKLDHVFCAPNSNSTAIDLDVTPLPQPDTNRTLIDIKFANKKTYLAFQEEFIDLVKKYYKNKTDDLDILDDMANHRIRVSEKIVKKGDAFLVDITPNLENLESTPTYRKSFGQTLTDEKNTEEKRRSASQRNACFNCDKDTHSLRDCPEPRNMKKVNKARNEFNRKELRYHDDNENEYGHLVPGDISDDLRAALGITATQLPLHIYKMRLFGYPPAWIEEAKLFDSGLSMFVEKDKKQLQPGEEDGETDTVNFKYDLQKIYDFPGFNVAPDHQYVDMHRVYCTPPMLPQHSKEEMIRELGCEVVNGYKKKKLRTSEIVDLTDRTSTTVADMELEDEEEEVTLPLGVTVYTKPPEPMEDGECSNDSRPRSPDEEDLKLQRQALLAEIAESSVFLDTSDINSSVNTTVNHSHLQTTIIENSENENRDNIAKDSGHVEDTIFGCPVLPSFSGHAILPDGEKFKEGVCDVIAFENLAESTGKYEKMKELIKKVRVFQQEHQKE